MPPRRRRSGRRSRKPGWQLSDILVTHRHIDHVQAIAPLKQRFGCRVVAPLKAGSEVPVVDAVVREGDTVKVGRVIGACLGDTRPLPRPHRLLVRGRPGLVRGDTLFTMGCGRVMESPHADMYTSLTRLAALPGDARVFSGHDYVMSNARFALAVEPDNEALQARAKEAERAKEEGRFLIPSTIAMERATNPFLRTSDPAVAGAVERDPANPGAVFQALREWKNRF
jgi:hydroxyacylglutathione hydrolase